MGITCSIYIIQSWTNIKRTRYLLLYKHWLKNASLLSCIAHVQCLKAIFRINTEDASYISSLPFHPQLFGRKFRNSWNYIVRQNICGSKLRLYSSLQRADPWKTSTIVTNWDDGVGDDDKEIWAFAIAKYISKCLIYNPHMVRYIITVLQMVKLRLGEIQWLVWWNLLLKQESQYMKAGNLAPERGCAIIDPTVSS